MGPPRATRAALTAATLATAGLLAGCGHTARVGAGRTLRVSLTEYRLRPSDVSASAGTLTIVAHNYGLMTHNLAVSQNGTLVAATKPIAPGAEATVVVTLAPGTYTLASTILSDQALGEHGTLTITR